MNFIQRAVLRYAEKMAVNGAYTLSDSTLGKYLATSNGTASTAGKTVNAESSMRVTTAWGCVRVLSETIGSLPWALYKKDKKGNAAIDDDHRLNVALHMPNSHMTHVEYRESMVVNLCLYGNAYSIIDRDETGEVSALYPLSPDIVTPKLTDGVVTYIVKDRGKDVPYPAEKIWHIKGFGTSGLMGLSPIAYARECLGTAMAAEEFGSSYFTNGGLPAGVVSLPGWLKEDQRRIARENLQAMLGGLGNAHKFALLEGGMKPEPWKAMPLEDIQFLELRKFGVNEICRVYRVPPHMVADLDRATFSNIEHQSQEFVTYTLLPYFTRFEAALWHRLLKPEQRRTHFLRFNVDGILRADSTGRSALYNSGLQNGWLNRNEVRAKENLPQVEGLDSYTVQVNMQPVDQLGKPQPQAQPRRPLDDDAIKDGFNMNMFLRKLTSSGVDAAPFKATLDEFRYATEAQHSAMLAVAKSIIDSNTETRTRVDTMRKALERVEAMFNAERSVVDENGDELGRIRVVK